VTRLSSAFGLSVLLLTSWQGRALAQAVPEDAAARATFRLGPVGLTPTFNLSQIGMDTNVMFEETDPTRDFTFTATPGARTFLRVGPSRLAAHTTADWVYFARTTRQRALNFSQVFAADVPFATFTPRLAGEYLNTRQRPNSEIDARVRRRTSGWTGGVLVRLSPITSLDVEVGSRDWTFDDVEVDGVLIGQALNRTVTETAVAFRTEVTPLTTLVVRAAHDRSRFLISTVRDASAWSLSSGFEFQPIALITGAALIGYQSFSPRDPRVEPFAGIVARVNVRYLVRDSMSLGLRVDRQVEFSYWPNESYYVSSAMEIEARHALAADWDVVGRLGRESLVYPRIGATPDTTPPARRDHRLALGGGAGYWLSFEGRIGIDIVYGARTSEVPGRSYRAFRIGGSFSYGF
jgi:hypothetical protein